MEWSMLPQVDHPNDRLPTFTEVLTRRARPPVDLYMFYLFLQREGAENVLDFWLDVQMHENLCRSYFKDVRKSGRTIREDWPQYWEYARRRGSIYGNAVPMRERLGSFVFNSTNRRSSVSSNASGLKKDTEAPLLQSPSQPPLQPSLQPSLRVLFQPPLSKPPVVTEIPRTEDDRLARTANRTGLRDQRAATLFEKTRRTTGVFRRPEPLAMDRLALLGNLPLGGGQENQVKGNSARALLIRSRKDAVRREELVASAEQIFERYLAPGAAREIYLPPSLRIGEFPSSSRLVLASISPINKAEAAALAQVPDIFHTQKEYIFRAMEQHAFPRFLRSKAFGNLTPIGALARLVAGILVLWVSLSCAFSLVFLDVKPKSKRLMLFLPFAISFLLIVSHQYELDPILAFLQQSETTPFRTLRVRETTACTMLLWTVPGWRL
ncbi:regulator of G protein signaling domain protein [Ceratobasidium sp. AG-Ba]|nr:regulator of G protein signaling domain protein [Ceratobasidium sp. AG-Ba]